MKKKKKSSREIKPGGVPAYITGQPNEVRAKLKDIREAIRSAAPRSIETMSYFEMPGYSYEGYDYNGMFAWFSYKAPFIRLHVRPKALALHKKDLQGYGKTTAIVSFPEDKPIPKALVKKLVKASIKDMKGS